MKILVIGIDGGDERIFRAMPMPGLHRLLEQNVCLKIEEDLWSRGWVEILTGMHGRETGAFYQKPVLGAPGASTQKFSTADYAANPQIETLWSKLSSLGHTVGFMNVPGMYPAPPVNGFAVSGGGAGASTSGAARMPGDAFYPEQIRELLETSGYILDTRLVASGIRDIDVFMNRLTEMTEKRTQAFLEFSRQFNSDMGFVVYRSVCVVQYLAMSEIEVLIKNNGAPKNAMQEKILLFYEILDKHIEKLVATLQPEHLVLVADHGQSPLLFRVNINAWLQENGFLIPASQGTRTVKHLAKLLAGRLPKGLKRKIKQSAPKTSATFTGIGADWGKTSAFAIPNVAGIYINDSGRFGGTGRPDSEVRFLVDEIVERFNSDPLSLEYGLVARPYRQKHRTEPHEAMLPDIWIDHPDTFLFSIKGKFIEPNGAYGPIKTLEGIDRDMYTGTKGRYPLFSASPFIAALTRPDDEKDLTMAYKLIVRCMQS
jgi:predicted AlkP superfamily phosphohydrolase/phosphomutase